MLPVARLRPTVLAVPPLYEPEKVKVWSVAVRLARFCPKAIPEMVLLESRFVPIDVLATTCPEELTERIALVNPVKARFVVVAFVADKLVEEKFVVVAEVPVAERNVKFCKVVEPETKRFVVVAFVVTEFVAN